MPGLLLCFVMRYDKYKKQAAVAADTEQSKITYFHCSLIGYIVGELCHIAFMCAVVMEQWKLEPHVHMGSGNCKCDGITFKHLVFSDSHQVTFL